MCVGNILRDGRAPFAGRVTSNACSVRTGISSGCHPFRGGVCVSMTGPIMSVGLTHRCVGGRSFCFKISKRFNTLATFNNAVNFCTKGIGIRAFYVGNFNGRAIF